MKWLFLATILALSACAGSGEPPLAKVHADDPVFQLNPGLWGTGSNALVTAPNAASPGLTQLGS